MNKKRVVAMVAGGTLAALGIGGTALAAGGDDSAPRGELSVGVAAAKEIAVRAAGGGLVESVERETEHGRAVWDVDVLVNGVEHDIDVDATTGTVLRHRIKGGTTVRVIPSATTTSPGGDDRLGDDRAGDDRGRGAEPGDDRGRGAEPGDDRGRGAEPGDDRGRGAEPGDDRGRGAEPGDDRGRGAEPGDDRGRQAEPGDDRGRSGERGDDRGGRSNGKTSAAKGDDHGGRGSGKGDDHGGRSKEKGDDHGSGGHGSDD